MKKLFAILLCLVAVMSLFVGCQEETGEKINYFGEEIGDRPEYLGIYYSKEARAMGGEVKLYIYEDGVFEIENAYEGGTVVTRGSYEELSSTKLSLTPEKQVTVIDDIPAEQSVVGEDPITAELKDDSMILKGEDDAEGVVYTRQDAKEAETDIIIG